MTVLTIYTNKDAGISEDSPNSNNNGTYLNVGQDPFAAGKKLRSFLEFNISEIPSTDAISTVTLYIYGDTPWSGGNITVYENRVTDNTWTEGGVTWNNQPTITTTNQTSFFCTTTTEWKTVDVTNIVKDAKNAGSVCGIRLDADGSPTFFSRSFSSREGSFASYLYVIHDGQDNIYVNSSTGSNSNLGNSCAAGHPFLTFQKAYNFLNINGTIHVCNSGADFSSETVTLNKSFSIDLNGNSGNFYGPKAS